MRRYIPLLIAGTLVLSIIGLLVFSNSLPTFAESQSPLSPDGPAEATPRVGEAGVYMTGFYLPGYGSSNKMAWGVDGDLITVNWAYIENTSPGYNWGRMDAALADAVADDNRVSVMFTTYNGWYVSGVVNAMPEYLWNPDNPHYVPGAVVDAGEWLCADNPDHRGCINGHWYFPRYWSDEYMTRYFNFIRSFGARYSNHPNLEFIAIGLGLYGENYAVDYWSRELRDRLVQAIQDDLNNETLFCETWATPCTTPKEVWIDFVKETVRVYREAFPNKPVFVQLAGSIWNNEDKRPIMDYANSLTPPVGLSFNMMYPQWFWAYSSTPYTRPGFFDIFPKHGPANERGTDEYHFQVAMEGYYDWMGCEGDRQVYWALLSSLSKHANYLRLNHDLFPAFVDLVKEWKPFLGRKLDGTAAQQPPAVFVALRDHRAPWFTCMGAGPSVESQRTGYGQPEYGDYAYWLYHDRNIPGGRSVPETGFTHVITWLDRPRTTQQKAAIEFMGNPSDPNSYNPYPVNTRLPQTKESWMTRRTDEDSGNPYMFFKIDDRYLYSPVPGTPVTITVTYLNDGGDTWSLWYDSFSGPKQAVPLGSSDPNVRNDDPAPGGVGGGSWAQKVFVITDGRFANGLNGGADFYLSSNNDGDNWFHMVMVSKGTGPVGPTPTPTNTPTDTPTPTATFTPTPCPGGTCPTPTPTPTPTNTFTPTPTPTSTPTPVATPTPTATPTPVVTPSTPPPDAVTIVLQEGRDGYTGVADTFIERGNKDANHGSDITLKLWSKENSRVNTLIRFDLSPVPAGKAAYRATLHLYVNYYYSRFDHTAYIRPYRLLKPWRELEATWNQAANGAPWGLPGASYAGVDYYALYSSSVPVGASYKNNPGWVEVDVTDLVNYWLQHPDQNYGFLLRFYQPEDKSVLITMLSSNWGGTALRPKLEITYYTPPTPTPTPTPCTGPGCPTPTPTPTATNTPTITPTPTVTPTFTPTPTWTFTPTPTVTPTPASPYGRIYGTVWEDVNQDGVRDAWEPTLAGAKVYLYKGGNTLIAMRVTSSDGYYEFSALDPDTYRLVEEDPQGYTSSTPNQIDNIIIQAGAAVRLDFGDYPIPTPTPTPTHTPTPTNTPTPTVTPTPSPSPTPSVTPTPTPTPGLGNIMVLAWQDLNKNYTWEPEEPPMVNVNINFYRDLNGNGSLDVDESIPVHRGRTDQHGSYTFYNVPTGWYIVQEVDPPGYISHTPNMVSLYIDLGVTGIAYFGDLPERKIYISYVLR